LKIFKIAILLITIISVLFIHYTKSLDSHELFEDRVVLVIESDDWGGAFWVNDSSSYHNEIKQLWKDMPYSSQYGPSSFETVKQLESFYNVLRNHKDSEKKSVVFQPNYIMANFDLQRDSVIEIPAQITNWHVDSNLYDKVQEGVQEGIFSPQLHWYTHIDYRRNKNDSISIFYNYNLQVDTNVTQEFPPKVL